MSINNNKFLRSGALITELGDFVNNTHIHFINNNFSTFTNNITVDNRINDNGTGKVTPYNCSYFKNNKNCIIANNSLHGYYRKYQKNFYLGNLFIDNTNCIVNNTGYLNQVLNGSINNSYYFNDIINSNELKYINVYGINGLTEGNPQTITIECTEIISDTPSADNINRYIATFYLIPTSNNMITVYSTGFINTNPDKPSNLAHSAQYIPTSSALGINVRNTSGTNNRYLFRTL